MEELKPLIELLNKTMPWKEDYCEDKYMEAVWDFLYIELKEELIK